MAPPRRTSNRAASATPARSNRGNSALPLESSATRRSTRGASKQPTQADSVINPNLPDVQTQQSYAYGSTKTPLLPDRLIASDRMSFQQMTSKLDAGILQAQQNFEQHATEAQADFDARSERAMRRASRERSRTSSREGSVDSETRKTRRTAAWASSLENSQLDNISEEPFPQNGTPDDDETRRGTDPSSFPSGVFDHSYSYERGNRGPAGPASNSTYNITHFFSTLWRTSLDCLTMGYKFLESTVLHIGDFIIRVAHTIGNGTTRFFELIASPEFLRFVLGITLGAAVMLLCFTSFCKLYTGYLCNPDSTSIMHLTLQEYCGTCSTTIPSDGTFDGRKDINKLRKEINILTQYMKQAEAGMDAKYDAKHATQIYSIEDLQKQITGLQNRVDILETNKNPSSDFTPLKQKINYFAPGTGAIINPHRTSPTRQKHFPSLLRRTFWNTLGLHKHISNPPSSALEPWEDFGDCWCSSDGDGYARLAVTMAHMIYPTEIVIEHYPISGSITPDTTPRRIEVWADFGHLTPEEWAVQGINKLQGMDPISPTMGKIGEAIYEATGRSNVQIFKMDVNKIDMTYHTDQITIRVVANYGADYTCLYRVRMHGVSVTPHHKVKVASDKTEL